MASTEKTARDEAHLKFIQENVWEIAGPCSRWFWFRQPANALFSAWKILSL